jgi:hypothetical protein
MVTTERGRRRRRSLLAVLFVVDLLLGGALVWLAR